MTKRQVYSKEFKLEAIRLLESGDLTGAEVALKSKGSEHFKLEWPVIVLAFFCTEFGSLTVIAMDGKPCKLKG